MVFFFLVFVCRCNDSNICNLVLDIYGILVIFIKILLFVFVRGIICF